MRLALLLSLLLVLPARANDTEDVSQTLDKFHAAAASADFDSYFGLFTADAWFLGTDAAERWSVDEFKQYAKPSFDAGRGWRYDKIERKVMFSEDGKTAWIDEILHNNKLGRCRGTAVLTLTSNGWRVAHYSLTMLIPNDIAVEVGEKTMLIDGAQD